MKAKMLFVAMCVIVAGFALDCMTVGQGVAPSTSPISGFVPAILGHGEGKACYMVIMSVWETPPKKPDANAAIEKAVSELGGDALINVRVYTKVTNYFVLAEICTVVEGDVVKLGAAAVSAPAPVRMPAPVAPAPAPVKAPAAPVKTK